MNRYWCILCFWIVYFSPLQAQNISSDSLKTISNADIEKIYKDLASIDYVFLKEDFTINTAGNDAKSNFLSFFQGNTTTRRKECAPTCLMYFQSPQDLLAKAEVFYAEGCNYAVFTIQEKEYVHLLSADGIHFFSEIFKMVRH
jgi:hypothetical protein